MPVIGKQRFTRARYTEYTVVPANAAAHKPPQVSFTDAATLPQHQHQRHRHGERSKRALVETLGATLVPYGDGVSERIRQLLPDLVVQGKLDPHIDDGRSLDDAAEALAAVEIGHARGKVVIEVST